MTSNNSEESRFIGLYTVVDRVCKCKGKFFCETVINKEVNHDDISDQDAMCYALVQRSLERVVKDHYRHTFTVIDKFIVHHSHFELIYNSNGNNNNYNSS